MKNNLSWLEPTAVARVEAEVGISGWDGRGGVGSTVGTASMDARDGNGLSMTESMRTGG